MSGGSYEYMHSEMANGEVEKFARYHEALVDDLEKVLEQLREGTLTEYDAANLRHVPFREPAAATEAMQCVIAKVRYAEELLGRLGEMMRSLADVAHAVEWWQSSDTGPDDVANALKAGQSMNTTVAALGSTACRSGLMGLQWTRSRRCTEDV